MDGEGEYDPNSKDMGAAEGAKGGGDENPKDYQLPGAPDAPADSAAKRKRFWQDIWEIGGAKPKDPYAYQKLSDKDIPMPEFPKEKNGLPPQKGGEGTEKTSFIEGEPSGRVLTAKDMATMEVEKDFPNMDYRKVEARYRYTGPGASSRLKCGIKLNGILFSQKKMRNRKNFQR